MRKRKGSNEMNHYILVRHGQSTANTKTVIAGSTDVELSELGIAQAKEAGEALKHKSIDVCFCSPRTRAKQTAQEIMKFHNAPTIVHNGLAERNYGEFELMPYTTMNEHPNGKLFWQYDAEPTYESAETLQQFLTRTKQFFEEIGKQYVNRTILIVAHGGTYKAVYYLLNGLPHNNNLIEYHFKNTELFEFHY